MFRSMHIICIVAIIMLAIPHGAASANAAEPPVLVPVDPSLLPDGVPANCLQENWTIPDTQQVTESILTCFPLPALWNGGLVVFAHGYEFDYPLTASPTLPYSQILSPDGKWSLPMLVNAMGFAFAMTSYTKNGLAVQQGMESTLRLVDTVKTKMGDKPVTSVYVVGASEGGLITTLLVEQHPEVFNGGMAVCGPIGAFQNQIDYWGDFRATFDVLFPGVLPDNNAVVIPESLMADWVKTPAPDASEYQTKVLAALQADLTKALRLLNITGAAYDPTNFTTMIQSGGASVLGLLTYNILATNESRVELGNIQPYDNSQKQYADPEVEAKIRRFTAEGDVAAAIAPYQTSGQLQVPLIVMHTTLDPIVPYWHQGLYTAKVEAAGSQDKFAAITIPTYGHCQFRAGQQVYAFARLLHAVTQRQVSGPTIQALLTLIDPAEMEVFNQLNSAYDVVNYRYYLPSVTTPQ